MLAVSCPQCGRRSLLSLSQIERVQNTSGGIIVFYTCSCGYPGLWVTGRRSRTSRRLVK